MRERNRLAAIPLSDQQPTAWDPNLDNGVTDLTLSGSTLYVAGEFTTVGSAARNRVAAFAANGTLTTWALPTR